MNYKLFIGIDQSKKTFDVCMLDPEKPEQLHQEQFENNTKGLTKMMMTIQTKYKIEQQEILFCAEHTGLYCLPLSVFLSQKQAHLWLENPLHIKLSSGLKRGKSDSADAKTIAHYCYTHRHEVKLYRLPSKTIFALKQLLSCRTRLIKQQTAWKITSKELAAFKVDGTGLIIKESKSLIKIFDRKIEAIEAKMLQLIKEDEQLQNQFELVKSVRGVGNQTALAVIVYTQGFTLFNDWRKFACYCGVAPFEYTSGTSVRGKTRVSHLGNKKLKALFTMCALNTIKTENEYKTYYNRRIQQGKNPMSTINIIRNKIISRIFAAVNRGTPYQQNYQQAA
jgi:transposase